MTHASIFRYREQPAPDWSAIFAGMTAAQLKAFNAWHAQIDDLTRSIDEDLAPGGPILPQTRRRSARLRRLLAALPWITGLPDIDPQAFPSDNVTSDQRPGEKTP